MQCIVLTLKYLNTPASKSFLTQASTGCTSGRTSHNDQLQIPKTTHTNSWAILITKTSFITHEYFISNTQYNTMQQFGSLTYIYNNIYQRLIECKYPSQNTNQIHEITYWKNKQLHIHLIILHVSWILKTWNMTWKYQLPLYTFMILSPWLHVLEIYLYTHYAGNLQILMFS